MKQVGEKDLSEREELEARFREPCAHLAEGDSQRLIDRLLATRKHHLRRLLPVERAGHKIDAGALTRKDVDHVAQFAALRDTIRVAQTTRAAEHRAAMKESVCAVVELLQGAGWPAEAIIVQIKQTTSSLKPDTDDDDLVGAAVRICIEHYYQDATLGSARQVLYTASLWSYA